MLNPRIAFVGLDGLAPIMAARLLTAGSAVTVHDPHRRLDGLLAAGARPARLPADAAEQADVVVLASSGAAAREHLFDHGGLTETLRTGGCVVDMSACPPAEGRATSERLARYGLAHVELCVLGGADDAESGDLLLVLGGTSRDVATASGPLAALGSCWHVGPVGAASVVTSVLRDATERRHAASYPQRRSGALENSATAPSGGGRA